MEKKPENRFRKCDEIIHILASKYILNIEPNNIKEIEKTKITDESKTDNSDMAFLIAFMIISIIVVAYLISTKN